MSRRSPDVAEERKRPWSPNATRRSLLLGGLCLCCAPLVASGAEQMGIEEISSGVFVRRGLDADAASGNANAIANIGFIIGRDAVLITDSGGSLADGKWLRQQVRARTDRPIRHVVMSHVHPDHCFGAAAFAEDRPEFVGHARLAGALQARGDFYRNKLAEIIGVENVASIILPTRQVGQDGAEIDLGGRKLHFRAHGTAHTDCDLSMLDEASGLLFPADLLFVGRVPSLDGRLLGWLNELDVLQAQGARRVVPGHGPIAVDATSAIANMRRYLVVLRDETRKAIAGGKSLETAVRTVGLAERQNWTLFDEYNSRNVTQAFKELEWE